MTDDENEKADLLARYGDRPAPWKVVAGLTDSTLIAIKTLANRVKALEARLAAIDGQGPAAVGNGDGDRTLPTGAGVGFHQTSPQTPRVRVQYRGVWSPDVSYAPASGVLHAGRTWRAKSQNAGCDPATRADMWERLG